MDRGDWRLALTELDARVLGQRPAIVLTAMVRQRLLALVETATLDPSVARFLREELERAVIVPEGAAGSVTIGSEVKFVDHSTRTIRQCKLAYPDEADQGHCVSVLSNVGSALLGLGPGQSISWTDGEVEQRLTVLEILRA
jgi:regulator of nucleoside diphosphate kinase